MNEVADIAIAQAMEHEEMFYQGAEFWVGVVFVLVVGFLFPLAKKAISTAIRQRITRIQKQLQDAENLKLDAQKLYAEYERKFVNTDNEVAEIIANQKEIIEQTKQKKIQELNQLLRQKQNEAESKIEQEFSVAYAEVNTLIYRKTLNILHQVIQFRLTSEDYQKLIDNSIDNIEKMEIN